MHRDSLSIRRCQYSYPQGPHCTQPYTCMCDHRSCRLEGEAGRYIPHWHHSIGSHRRRSLCIRRWRHLHIQLCNCKFGRRSCPEQEGPCRCRWSCFHKDGFHRHLCSHIHRSCLARTRSGTCTCALRPCSMLGQANLCMSQNLCRGFDCRHLYQCTLLRGRRWSSLASTCTGVRPGGSKRAQDGLYTLYWLHTGCLYKRWYQCTPPQSSL